MCGLSRAIYGFFGEIFRPCPKNIKLPAFKEWFYILLETVLIFKKCSLKDPPALQGKLGIKYLYK